MNELDYKLYVLAELSYNKQHPNLKEEELYPLDWYSFNNYKLKNEIIAEALREKKLIKDTQKYMLTQEGIRKSH